MSGEETRELNVAIAKLENTAKAVNVACKVLMGMFLLAWAISVGVVVSNWGGGEAARTFVYVIMHGCVMFALLLIASRIFSHIASGESPFTKKSAALLRFIGILFLVRVAVEAVLSVGFDYDALAFGAHFVSEGISGVDQSSVDIDASAMFLAFLFFGLSAAFRYGSLLQRLSDETE